MALRLLLALSLALTLLTVTCATATPPPGPTPTAGPAALPNLLTQVEGQLEVRREGSSRFAPVAFGADVQPGDTLRLSGGKAAVFCGNEALWDKSPYSVSPEGEQGIPCLAGRPPRPAPNIAQLRGDAITLTGEVPYVLSPRSGFVLDDRPALRWQTLPVMDVYTVTLQSDDGQDRPAVTVQLPSHAANGELPYPSDWPPLQARGASYQVVVQEGSRRSDEGTGAGQGFSLLEPVQAVRVHSQAEHLRQRPLTDPGRTLLLAELYLSYNLRSEAVELLSAMPGGEGLAAIQQRLGEAYLAMGLFAEAEAAFGRALALAQAADLPEAAAAAHFGLGLAACGLWDQASAQAECELARAGFQALEMAARAGEVAGWLAAASCSLPPAPTPTRGSSGGVNE